MTIGRIAGRAVASLPAPLRWRARNAVALARWLGRGMTGEGPDTYDEQFWTFHDTGDWNGLAGVLLQFCAPRSIVDVGCGDGKLLAAVRSHSPSIDVLGIDGSRPALARAAAAGVPVRWRDLSSTRSSDLAALRADVAGFDVAVSLETAEHLPPWAGAAFAGTLSRARLVVFSAAQPGQGGTLHMNERPAAYWRSKFAHAGLDLAAADAACRDAVAALDLPWWYAKNIQLFERRA
jgi:SAM-dependent methyltransferase